MNADLVHSMLPAKGTIINYESAGYGKAEELDILTARMEVLQENIKIPRSLLN